MQENISYTKSNLIAVKNSLEFSKKGYELLDKKRNVLILNMMHFIDRAKEIQSEVKRVFEDAYEALKVSNITLGVANVEEIAYSIPEAEEFTIDKTSVMGVQIPKITYEPREVQSAYSLYYTNAALDTAMLKFYEIKKLLYELAEVEDSVCKLADEIKRTQKRANALNNIQIPKYEELVKKISEILEEKEREEFFRLKKLKQKKQ